MSLSTRQRQPTVRVVPMRARHVAAVHAIEERAYPRPWAVQLFHRELTQVDRRYLVASRRRQVLGYAGVQVVVGEAHVLTVAVDPDLRRGRIATRLLLELLGAARELGATDVTLEVRESNTAAAALYRRFGFAVEGRRPGYYVDNGEAAAIMWLRGLTDPATTGRLAAEAARAGHPLPPALTR